MAGLYTQQSRNITKTWFLMSLFFIVIIALGWFLSAYYGSPNILYFAVIFSVLMNIASYWWSDKIVLKITGARPANREEFFDLYTVTENLCITAGLPLPEIYVIADPAPNAFATGRNKEHAVVCATTGLLQMLNRSELEGVIAHELSHIKNYDIRLMLIVSVLVGTVVYLADWFMRSLWWGGNRNDREDKNGLGPIFFMFGILLALLTPLIATLIQLAISRRREFLADGSGALLTKNPEGLALALEKISHDRAVLRFANNATAHLFIANPFKGKSIGRRFSGLFDTHPPMEERVKILRSMRP